MKRLSILGSTGSIGQSCLRVVEDFAADFRIVGLAAGGNIELLARQVERFRPRVVSVSSPDKIEDLGHRLGGVPAPSRPRVLSGLEGMIAVATHPEAQLLVSAVVGVPGLLPTYEAIRCGKRVALANKEILVIAGQLITATARRHQVELLPIDSEHNAIHQCLRSGERSEVKRLILTASGGPFRSFSRQELNSVTPQMALQHPTWKMGNRITIDSATLMNKGYEILEAHWLFDMPVEKISVLIHPQSTIHSMVEFVDGSVIAQLGVTDMQHPIQYALTYPQRFETQRAGLDFREIRKLEFMEPDPERFPCLELAYRAARQQGAQPCVLNAADEVAVGAFLEGKVPFVGIAKIIRKMMDHCDGQDNFSSVQDILKYDEMIRHETRQLIERDYARAR